MAWIGIRAGISKILALPPNIAAAHKPLLQVNFIGAFTVQSACISGSSLRDKSKARPAPFPYQTKPYNLWRACLQDTTTHRFDENTKIIVVEGPIAAGKSKFAKSLAEDLDMLHMPEVTMDDYYINSYGYDMRKLDPQLPPSARSYDENNFCIEPNHENAANFQIVKYKLRYSQYIDALAHLMNTGWYLCICTWTNFSNISLFNECKVYTAFLILLFFYWRFTLGFSQMKRLLLVAVCGLCDGNISVS